MRMARQARCDATRLWRLCRVNTRVDGGRLRLVADRLVNAGGARNAAILSYLLRMLRLEDARFSARVESAAPLGSVERKAIEEGLARRYGTAVAATFAVEPALVGGVRLTVGSDVYDGSIRGRLAALAERF